MLYTPSPGDGGFFSEIPRGTPGRGILKLRIPRGPRGGGYFLVPGYGISSLLTDTHEAGAEATIEAVQNWGKLFPVRYHSKSLKLKFS